MHSAIRWACLGVLLAILLLPLGACSDDDSGIVLVWDASPTALSVGSGDPIVVRFDYPGAGAGGDPSLQFIAVTGDTVNAYMCDVADCNPANVLTSGGLPSALAATTGSQVYVPSPGVAITYYVYIYSTLGSDLSLQATGT